MLRGLLEERTLDELAIEDEDSFDHVGLYSDLKDVVLRAKCPFRILPAASAERWDRALFLNLTFWEPTGGGHIVVDDSIPADVITHVAWHHLAARALADAEGGALDAAGLALGEAIASAFDVYLVGRLLGHSPDSTFLESQVPAMAESASQAGLSADDFEVLLRSIADDPDRAFEDLRQLLFDATIALTACTRAEDATATLQRFDAHRFAALLHHYELSNWILYARAYANSEARSGDRASDVDRELRAAPVALDWLAENWIRSHAAE
jgi:hypothetical protein